MFQGIQLQISVPIFPLKLPATYVALHRFNQVLSRVMLAFCPFSVPDVYVLEYDVWLWWCH